MNTDSNKSFGTDLGPLECLGGPLDGTMVTLHAANRLYHEILNLEDGTKIKHLYTLSIIPLRIEDSIEMSLLLTGGKLILLYQGVVD